MSFLLLLVGLAVALALASLTTMVLLIVARMLRVRQAMMLARCRRGILDLLTRQNVDDEVVRRHVVSAARCGALATIVLEVFNIVRGGLRATFVARLASAGAARHLRHGLRRGRSADRVRAAEALAAFDSREAASALRRAANDKDSRVRFAALRAAIEIGVAPPFGVIVQLAVAARGVDRGRALALLECAVAASSGEAAHGLLRTDLPASVRVALIAGLGDARDMAHAKVLLVVALDHDPNVRAAAIGALALIGSPQGFATIVRALRDPSWPVRVRAANAVGELRLTSARRELGELQHDGNWWVRLRASEALEALTPPQLARGVA